MTAVLSRDHTVLLVAGFTLAAVTVRWALPSPAGQRVALLSTRTAATWRLDPGLLVGAAGLAAFLVDGPLLALLALVAGLLARRQHGRLALRRAAQQESNRAVEACAALSAELTAGRSPAEALTVAAGLSVGPFSTGLAMAAAAERLGGDAPGALVGAATTSAVPRLLRGLAACWEVGSVTGAGLARAVEQVAEAARADNDRLREVEAELAGPRATAQLLAVLPLGGLLMAAGLGADPLHQLFHTRVGVACTVAGVGLELLGLAWTARIIRAAKEA